MCVATGHTEPDIVGPELEASQSLVCLYESEQVREQSKNIYIVASFQCSRGCIEVTLEESEIAHFNLLFGIT